jgi:hypothetical protein
MTRSPLASLDPLTVIAVIRRTLPGYLLIPLSTLGISAGMYGLMRAGVSQLWLNLVATYQVFLFCSLTGAVMYRSKLHLEVDIPKGIETDYHVQHDRLDRERQAVASHAYGFISRGNREGGLKHVQDRIDEEADVDGAYQWFFDEMMRWESSDVVLYFAQAYLSRLLRLDQHAAAIRLLTRCLHRNANFHPLEQDRQLVTRMLQEHRRPDLLAALEKRNVPS